MLLCLFIEAGFLFCAQIRWKILTLFLFQDETPLFLAAKEGCYETARLLLDHFANRDITDQMDRLPRDVAHERRHQDIVKLLEEYRVNSPVAMNGFATSPPMAAAFVQHHAKPGKKKSRKSSQAAGVDHANKVALPPMEKKKKKKGGHHHHHHHHGHLAGVEPMNGSSPCTAASLESPQCLMELPPSYETACGSGHPVVPIDISPNNITLEQASLHHTLSPEWLEHMQQLDADAMMQQQQQQHGHYPSQSSPLSAATGSPMTASSTTAGGSPSSRLATSPLTHSYSSPAEATPSPGSITSPSSLSTSPPQVPVTSPPTVMSPSRKGYPTSPTHFQVRTIMTVVH